MKNRHKFTLTFLLLLLTLRLTGQSITHNISGGFESNTHLYVEDKPTEAYIDENKGKLRSNNYFQLNYNSNKLDFGIQYEAYLPNSPLVGYSPSLNDNKIATYYASYKSDRYKITAGYFYEQFGNGTVLRFWEDRQLGINNSLKGIRVWVQPTDFMNLTGIFGKQRIGFETSKGSIHGIDMELDLDNLLHFEASELLLGFSYVGRYENEFGKKFGGPGNNLVPPMVNAYSMRMQVNKGKITAGIEYSLKGEDVRVARKKPLNGNKFKGNAIQCDFGYSKKGFGLNVQFRRIENFAFYSDRVATDNLYGDQVINYLPALTKQHDYSLTNLYVYAPQSQLTILNSKEFRSGEIGTQFDVFYNIKKNTLLGGKYGAKIAVNLASWYALKAKYDINRKDEAYFDYKANFFQLGNLLFRDASVEFRKKISPKFSSIFTLISSSIDPALIKGGAYGKWNSIRAQTLVVEAVAKLKKTRSLRVEAQHLWTKQDQKNWVALTLEYSFSSKLSIFMSDMYNYGYDKKQLHFYNFGMNFTKGATRVALSYGRQRKGILCVGGICRSVPAYTGLTLNINTAF